MAAVTIRDVAKYAGVGVGTVSRVINQHDAVSADTRRRVLAAIDALNYSPNITARRLSLGKTMTIGVILPFFTNPSYVERLRGVESVLADTEYDLILFNAETANRRDVYFRDVPRRERVDGLLIVTHALADEDATRFLQAEVPTVLIDARHPMFSYVTIDDFAGGYRATRYLLELGHRRIGYVSDFIENALNFGPVRDRYLGYRRALEEYEAPFRPEYHKEGIHGRMQARQMAYEILSLDEPPTAIFAYSDTQAIGILEAARDLQVRVPEDLSVIGFDDIEAAEFWHLTTIHQPLFESGVEGSHLLLDEVARASPAPRHVVLTTNLVIRNTTAPPGAASV